YWWLCPKKFPGNDLRTKSNDKWLIFMLMRGNLARNTSNREFSQKVFLATDLFRVPKTLVLSILLFKHISLEFASAGEWRNLVFCSKLERHSNAFFYAVLYSHAFSRWGGCDDPASCRAVSYIAAVCSALFQCPEACGASGKRVFR